VLLETAAAPGSTGRETPAVTPITEMALQIRAFELKLLELFNDGLLSGTVHTCVGQEFCAAALHPHLRPGLDAFCATHRGHGHYLAHGGPPDKLLAEMMGREGALCLGRGGTQNLLYERFFSAGIQGGSAPIAVGYAWAMKQRGEHGIAVAQIGDGTLGEGALYEAFTFAAWLKAPVLFLLECNGWAQSTDVRRTTPGDILQRAAGFGLEADRKTDDDPEALHEHLGRVVERVRSGVPFLQLIETRRLMAHSKGDDDRPHELVAELWENDPLSRILHRSETARQAQVAAKESADEIAREVSKRPLLDESDVDALPSAWRTVAGADFHADGHTTEGHARVAEELNRALHEMMAESTDVVLVGEDLLDPYGGAFKVSKGLSTRFPEQVLSTPIAEAGIAGISNGMALAGMRPVAEVMFADFVTLSADQLINFAAKFHYMYGGRLTCPLTLRLVSGAGRGYGPTHSQSLERLFCGVPGLRVVALSQRHDPCRLLTYAVMNDDAPVVFVENKLLYGKRGTMPIDAPPLPLGQARIRRPGSDITIASYGRMLDLSLEAAEILAPEGVSCEVIDLQTLKPLDADTLAVSAAKTGRFVFVEEGTGGVGAEVCTQVTERVGRLPGRIVRVAARDAPIPSSGPLERRVIPQLSDIVNGCLDSLRD
jgi:2-oxoisovalerate dehydrogenase E1 component